MGNVRDRFRLRFTYWLKCPVLFPDALVESRSPRPYRGGRVIIRPRGSEVDPLLNCGDLLRRQRPSRRHLQSVMADGPGQQTQLGIARDNRWSAVSAL